MAYVNLAATTKNHRATQINTDIGTSALVKFYSGTAPATPDTAATGTLLATLTGNASAWGTVSGAVVTANAITQANAVATGTVGYVRVCTSAQTAGTAAGIVDLDAGTSGTSVIMNTTSIVSGGPVQITACTFTEA